MNNDSVSGSGEKIRVSVVIPTYQREAVLLQTLRYIAQLPVRPDETVVVDQTPEHDPETEEALSRWHCEGMIRRIRPDKPSITGAMNRGLREAAGDIVLFLDDDIIPVERLVEAHRQAHARFPEAWAVVGQVIQAGRDEGGRLKPEKGLEAADRRAKIFKPRILRIKQIFWKSEIKPQSMRNDTEGEGAETVEERERADGGRRKAEKREATQVSGFTSHSCLRADLDFRFNGSESAWVANVIACNLSVKRKEALAIGGFDENFIPPVSYRFETEFARRIIAAGGKIRFEPGASIVHLRAPSGGTRSLGSHLTSGSPLHGVGDYYYALCCGKGIDRALYIMRRPFREVCTRFHLSHPWWIPVKFFGELRAVLLAVKLFFKRYQTDSVFDRS